MEGGLLLWKGRRRLKEGSGLPPNLHKWLQAAAWVKVHVGREEGLAVLWEEGKKGGVLQSQ